MRFRCYAISRRQALQLIQQRPCTTPRGYSTSQQASPGASVPKPAPPPIPPQRVPQQSGSGSKVVTSVLILGGVGAGIGAYYYYDPNADVFRYARSALGIQDPTNCEPPKKVAPVKQVPVAKPKETVAPARVAPAPKKEAPVLTSVAPPPPAPLSAPVATASAAAATSVKKEKPAEPVVQKTEKKEPEVATTTSGDGNVPKMLLVTALKAQQEAMLESYEEKVKVLRKEFERRLSQAEKVSEAERFVELKAKYHEASANLAAIEQGIEARQEQNLRAKRLRSLWAQVNGLHARVNHPEYHGSVTTEIDKSALLKVVEVPDQFVTQMVASLPGNVHSLDSLKSRFSEHVEPVCKSVGLINEGEGFSVWKYAFGRLLSSVVGGGGGGSGVKELSTARNTHEVLSTARKALDKSDLLSAAIAVNNLTGLPRQVASDWLADARTLLETNQTLFVLMTYAASNNVF